MKKGWKIIIIIALIAILLGLVCFGVGIMTGADMERILSVVDSKYPLDAYYQYGQEWIVYFQQIWQTIFG